MVQQTKIYMELFARKVVKLLFPLRPFSNIDNSLTKIMVNKQITHIFIKYLKIYFGYIYI